MEPTPSTFLFTKVIKYIEQYQNYLCDFRRKNRQQLNVMPCFMVSYNKKRWKLLVHISTHWSRRSLEFLAKSVISILTIYKLQKPINAVNSEHTSSRASKNWRREDARPRKYFENLHKICTFERETEKTICMCSYGILGLFLCAQHLAVQNN